MALKMKPSVTYKKIKGAAGSQGTDYQIKLLEHFMLDGFQNKDEFLLSTENEEACIFDDVVYQTQNKIILLQAKHTCRNIGFDQLFSLKSVKGDFNLYKYLKTFPTIVNNFGTENIDVIICTNSKFNEEKINSSLNKEIKTEKLKYFKKVTTKLMPYINNIEFHSFNSNQELLIKYISNNISDVSEKDVKLFLDKLSLVYVSDKDLDDGIEALIKKIDFTDRINLILIRNNIFNKIKTWFQSDKGIYLTKNNVLAYFSEIISQNYIHLKINSLFLLKDEYVKKLDKDDYPVSQNNLILLEIKNKNTYDLHEFKIYQFLINDLMFINNKSDKEKLRDQIIFVNPQFSENVTTSLIQSFELPEYVYLVVPIFDLKTFNKIQHLIKNIIEVQKSKQYKKIIFIADTVEVKNELNKFSTNIKNFAINIKFSDFTETTRNRILQQKINFQGNKIPFQNIIENKNVNLDDFIDEHTLLQLIINKDEIVVNNVKNYEEISYYVDRNFNKIDKNLNPESEFKYSEKDFSEIILKKCDTKFVIITDSPGMGKSTILNKLDHLLRAEPYWIIKVNLNDCSNSLRILRSEKRGVLTLDDFLTLIKFSIETQLERKIFSISENVVLLLDALDEVLPDYTRLILNLLSSVSKCYMIRKIVITSRIHVLKHFKEKYMDYDTYCLVPFSEADSVNLLSKFWWINLNETNKFDKIQTFAENLIFELNKKTSWGRIKTLIGIPLQTKMVGDIFTKHCKFFLENTNNTVDLPETLNLSWLYDEFIKRKKEIYIEEKCNAAGNLNIMDAADNRFENAINEHIREALKLEFPNQLQFIKILDTPRNIEENILLKMGILIKSDNRIQFIHKTLSEYFATRHICELILENEITEEFSKYLMTSYFLCHNMFITYMLENKSIPYEIKEQFFHLNDGWTIRNLIECQPEFILLWFTKSGYKRLFKLNHAETLHENVGHNHTKMFLKKLDELKNVMNLKDKSGKTPLHLACRWNSKEIVELLFNKGYRIDVRDNCGRTPLHYAAELDNKAIVEFLIDINVVNNYRNTKTSLQLGFRRIVDFFLDREHFIDVRDKYGRTPLHDAVSLGKTTNVELLIDKGHPIDVHDNDGRTPLHDAVTLSEVTILGLLINKGHSLDVGDKEEKTPLHNAVLWNKLPFVEFLIDKGQPIDVRDKFGKTPLHYAAEWHNKGIVEFLLDKGHPMDVRDNDGKTPLHKAVLLKKMPFVEFLIDKGHPIDVRDNYGRTPLHDAISCCLFNNTIIKLLIDKGHPIDVRDNYGRTPLHHAVSCCRFNSTIIELLIDEGHSKQIRDKKGKIPLDYVTKAHSTHIQYLLENTSDIKNEEKMPSCHIL